MVMVIVVSNSTYHDTYRICVETQNIQKLDSICSLPVINCLVPLTFTQLSTILALPTKVSKSFFLKSDVE